MTPASPIEKAIYVLEEALVSFENAQKPGFHKDNWQLNAELCVVTALKALRSCGDKQGVDFREVQGILRDFDKRPVAPADIEFALKVMDEKWPGYLNAKQIIRAALSPVREDDGWALSWASKSAEKSDEYIAKVYKTYAELKGIKPPSPGLDELLVPVEPTNNMFHAFWDEYTQWFTRCDKTKETGKWEVCRYDDVVEIKVVSDHNAEFQAVNDLSEKRFAAAYCSMIKAAALKEAGNG